MHPRRFLTVRHINLSLALALCATVLAGCSRQRYRERADKDVEAIISQKNIFPDWQVQNWHTYPDPRSRFSDPSCPDYPPYPPDDYAAKLLSPNPQRPGRGGVGRHEGQEYLKQIMDWDAQNRAETPDAIEKPVEVKDTNNALSSSEKPYRLKLDQTIELALYNSREYQDRREDLYLAALPVSLERFQFSAQAFAADQLIRLSTGNQLTNGGESWVNSSSFGFNKRFASGATLLVQLANQLVVDLSNNRPTVSISTLTGTIAQPLLQGAGRAVNLENLTQAERTLLYAIRSYSRFRNLFYYAITGGGGYTNNPYGLQGLSTNLGRGVGANLTANSVGYLSTLQRSAILVNEQKNVASVEQFLKLFQNLKEGGGVTELQVVRVEQRLLQSRALVLKRTQEYIDSIDNFKLQLGVPATLALELDDEPIRPVRGQLARMELVYDHLREHEIKAYNYNPKLPVNEYRERWDKLLTESNLVKGTALAKDWPAFAKAVKGLTDEALKKRVSELLEERRKLLDDKAKLVEGSKEYSAILEKIDKHQENLDRHQFEQALRNYEAQPWLRLPAERRIPEQAIAFRATFDAGLLVAIAGRNQRLAALRSGWPEVPRIDVEGTDLLRVPLDEAYLKVAQSALTNRLDLMNARAQVVDAWRQVTVRANALQGIFNVEYGITAATPVGGSEAMNFSATRTLQQIRLRLEPPFVRRAERNNYRAALISYQRQRRNLQAFEDNIVTDSRTDLRTVRQLYQVYLVQQRSVEVAYAQVENARGTLLAPPDPRAPDTAGNVAALTQQLLEAQGTLVQAQNDLYTSWVSFLTARMEVFLDIERLIPDERGLWTNDSSPTRVPDDGKSVAPSEPERLPLPFPNGDPFPPLIIPPTEK